MNIIEADGNIKPAIQVAIVQSEFNRSVVDRLFAGATRALAAANVMDDAITVVKVPGAFEIATAVRALLNTGKYDAVITLGAVIRGETPHFDYICQQCAHGISQLALEFSTPVIFGVLTVDTFGQALVRSGDEESNKSNKGAEAANAALAMIQILDRIQNGR